MDTLRPEVTGRDSLFKTVDSHGWLAMSVHGRIYSVS